MTKTYETKLTVTGAPTPPPRFTFNANGDFNRPVMTIQADGKIVLHDDADPTEAAKQCIAAMGPLLQGLLQTRENETVEKIAAWLREGEKEFSDCDIAAHLLETGMWKQ